jgi:predicted RNA-binding Zn ribbon-like protein
MATSSPLLGGTPCLDLINSRVAVDHPDLAPADIRRLRRLRLVLHRILDAEARGIGAAEKDLAALNRVLARAGGRRGLVPTVRGYGWGWLSGNAGPDGLLWPVAFSAARLLAGPELSRLRPCDGCGRLFLDMSRNRSRRWCDMQACGNRAKVARHRARKD